jgi:signal transduction histidine kinase
MPTEERQPNPEREDTDESLRVEREKADAAIGDKPTAVDEAADAVIAKARARADAVVSAARREMDRRSTARPQNAPSPKIVEGERAIEDQVLRAERKKADETVRVERAEHATELATERSATDEDLSRERARSDDAVATRDEFLAIVSHDLRNMLGAVAGFAALIEKEELEENHTQKVLAHAQRIHRAGYRMGRLVGDLVDVASIHAGSLAVTREVGDPTPVVSEAADTFGAQASASGVSLVVEIEPSLPRAAFDAARILQVLVNLLSNAIKFTPPNGTVLVHVARVGKEIRFAVSDTGRGVPTDKLETVFERFLQVTADRRGVGLGLYIAKCIVRGHGGRIWAESTVGKGSTFSFTLPVHEAS